MRALARGAALGLAGGLVWGVASRVWMRLISDQPEFTWTGTLMILALSAWLGLCVGLAGAALASGRSGWWRLAVAPGLAFFASLGIFFAPAFLFGGLLSGARGRGLQVVGGLAVLAPGVLIALMLRPEPHTIEHTTLGEYAVGVGGFLALSLAVAAITVPLWRRRPRRASAVQRRPFGADRGVRPVAGVHDGLVGQAEQA